MWKYFTRWGKKTIAVSNDLKRYVTKNYNVNPIDVTVTINGIDIEKFSRYTKNDDIQEEFNIDKNKKQIVYVSRLDSDRSMVAEQLIAITHDLYLQNNNIEVIIVGGGNRFKQIEDMVREANKEIGHVVIKLTGARTDINKFCSIADIFIGVSRATLEAMASEKCTIIGSNDGYMGIFNKDILQAGLENNFTARGFETPNKERLKADIITLLNMDGEKIKETEEFSREVIKNYYSTKRMADDVVNMYKSALKKEAVVVGYYGFNNIGDEAMLGMVVDKFKDVCNLNVLSYNEEETSQKYNVMATNRYNIFKILRAIKKSDVVILGGGNLFQDITSNRSIYYYLSIVEYAIRCKKPVYIVSQGIGTIKNKTNIYMFKKVISKIKQPIYLRDKVSIDFLNSLGIENTEFMPDITINYQAKNEYNPVQIKQKFGIDLFIPTVLICVRDWKQYENSRKWALLATRIKQDFKMQVVFVPFQYSEDLNYAKNIVKYMDKEDRAIVLEQQYDIDELLSIISHSKILIGMRLHAIIFGMKSNVRTIAISYEKKIDNLLKTFGLKPTCSCKDIDVEKLLTDMTKEDNHKVVQAKLEEFKENINSEIEDIKIMIEREV